MSTQTDTMRPAIFLDRDGTINEDTGDLYSRDNLIFIPRAFEALRMLQARYLLFIITNQPGIGRGVFSGAQFEDFMRDYTAILRDEGITIIETYCCPHLKDDNCECRKPSPHYIELARDRYAIDVENSYVIGDHPHDIEMGRRAKAHTVYLLTGHGAKHRGELLITPEHTAANLFEAAQWIVTRR